MKKVTKKAISYAKWINCSNCAPGDNTYLFRTIHVYEPPRFSRLPEWREAQALFMHFNVRSWVQLLRVQVSAASQSSKYWFIYLEHRGFARRQSTFQGQTWIKKLSTHCTLQTSWRLLSMQLTILNRDVFNWINVRQYQPCISLHETVTKLPFLPILNYITCLQRPPCVSFYIHLFTLIFFPSIVHRHRDVPKRRDGQ